MADFSSARFGILRQEPGNPLFPVLPDGVRTVHFVRVEGASGSNLQRGDFSGNVAQRFSATPDTDSQRFAGWYTDETWLVPGEIDFGSIASPVRRTIALTNSRRTAIDLTLIDVPAGVTVISPGLPITIQPFGSVVVTFEASTSGAPVFDEVITFTTSVGILTARARGRRVFPVEVIPQRPLRETLTFVSDVMRSTNATEKAMILATSPASDVVYEVRFDDDLQRIRFRNLMLGLNVQLIISAPKWYEAERVTQAALSTDTEIFLDTANASYEPDGPIALYLPDDTFVRNNVQEIQPDRLVLAAELGTDIPLGALVMPTGLGYIEAFPDYQTFPINAEDAQFTIVFNRELDLGATLPGMFPTHDSLPVLEFTNESVGGTVAGSGTVPDDAIASGISNRAARNRFPLGIDTQAFEHLIQSRADAWSWRRFLHYQAGSARELLVPTFRNDIPGATTTAANLFEIENTRLLEFFSATPSGPRGALRFEYPDGTVLYRNITDVAINGANEQVTVDGSLIVGEPVISFLQRARIVSDTASFEWRRPDETIIRFRYRTVQV